jgi:peptidoglycan/LPS O-acetylase OafA/YrhL
VHALENQTDRTATITHDLWLPQIEGLRARAIVAVLIHHGNSIHFSNWALGNSGVAIFLSISGFLAYYVLWRDEHKLGRIDYNYFLFRRILRIWPAYFLVIAIAFYLASPDQRAASNELPLFTFTANFYQAAHLPSQLLTLGILWSIAVEEQFYLVAPLMYFALRSRHWLAFSIGIALLANLARILYAMNATGSVYYLSLTYADIFWAGRWLLSGKPKVGESITVRRTICLPARPPRLSQRCGCGARMSALPTQSPHCFPIQCWRWPQVYCLYR